MDDVPHPSQPRETRSGGCGKWLSIAFMVTAAMFCLVVLRTCSAAVTGLKDVATIIAAIPDKFQSHQITQTFRERLVSITPTHGDILELATAERDETLTKYDMKTLFFNTVYLGTTTSEIRVPAVYRYHIKLSDEWKLGSRDHTCVVIAPVIRPSLPPAIRTDKMETKSSAGWLRFNASHNLAELHASITPMLEQRAGNPSHISQVREPARKAVAEFVKNWLVKEEQWKAQGFTDIVVVFADEPSAKSLQEAEKQPPVMNLVP